MKNCVARIERSPIGVTQEVRPEVRDRAEPATRGRCGIVVLNQQLNLENLAETTGGDCGVVLINFWPAPMLRRWPEANLMVSPVSIGARPLAPPHIIPDKPSGEPDVFDYYDQPPEYTSQGRARAILRRGGLPDMKWDLWE